jgi:formate dehydrogenase maturation protein FdhE
MMPCTASPDYDSRIHRARQLAGSQPAATQALIFYAHLAEFHKGLYERLATVRLPEVRVSSGDFRSELDLASLLLHFPELLSVLQRVGPVGVAETAREMALHGPAVWITVLTSYWEVAGKPTEGFSVIEGQPASSDRLTEFIARAFLQPYAEFLSRRRTAVEPVVAETYSICPICGSAPMLVVLRGDGADEKYGLQCSLCLHEWETKRGYCLHCGEDTQGQLAKHFVDNIAHVSLEGCDNCMTYLSAVHLAREREAIPVVDDISGLALSRWAREHGYRRWCSNLLGT